MHHLQETRHQRPSERGTGRRRCAPNLWRKIIKEFEAAYVRWGVGHAYVAKSLVKTTSKDGRLNYLCNSLQLLIWGFSSLYGWKANNKKNLKIGFRRLKQVPIECNRTIIVLLG